MAFYFRGLSYDGSRFIIETINPVKYVIISFTDQWKVSITDLKPANSRFIYHRPTFPQEIGFRLTFDENFIITLSDGPSFTIARRERMFLLHGGPYRWEEPDYYTLMNNLPIETADSQDKQDQPIKCKRFEDKFWLPGCEEAFSLVDDVLWCPHKDWIKRLMKEKDWENMLEPERQKFIEERLEERKACHKQAKPAVADFVCRDGKVVMV
jgi:hypothetical protein